MDADDSSPKPNADPRTPRQWRSGDIVGLIILVIILATVIFGSGPSINPSRNAARPRTQCLNNIRNVAFAVMCYHKDHGTFPPAYVADKNGRPLYSWRVLVLPYLDQLDRYRNFHLDEPWDSPHNIELSNKAIEVFRCPDGDDDPFCTNYLAVVGPNMAWKGSEPTKLIDITDAHEQTILLVEAAGTGIHWAEPRDLYVNQIPIELNPKHGLGISSHHSGGTVMVALVSGSARTLGPTTPPETLRRLLEINDGQTVEDFP